MLYSVGKIKVSGFGKSAESVLQSWAKHFTDQNINALKIAKNSKTYEIFMVIVWDWIRVMHTYFLWSKKAFFFKSRDICVIYRSFEFWLFLVCKLYFKSGKILKSWILFCFISFLMICKVLSQSGWWLNNYRHLSNVHTRISSALYIIKKLILALP